MKQLFVIAALSFFCTSIFAQANENSIRKNELSLAPYSVNQIYINSSANDGWIKSSVPNEMLLLNYRRWLNESTALRLGGDIDFINLSSDPLIVFLEARVGMEKYLNLSDKWQLYGGGQFQIGVSGLFNENYSSFGVGVVGIGGLRYNITDRWSLNSELILPIRFGTSEALNLSAWSTGIEWRPVTVNFRF